ncbi:Extracellular matrix-binding ebh, putative [Babesia ovata]|uniref:Extracellular matrix-binding ebh, putative n=1 Tax=Babesia ovata TaxID=189622 RepID=A0A2H6KC49_9APIC|nr:Extracellular matrix-binding ebh, putative [Babesia ovata]GBE60565.1 Extracellular matrix-binding ebh, putative [Babesia ovata]
MLLRPPPKKALKAPTNSTGQANEKHKIHFYSLNSWIETAESIRKAAWSKAEEAYSQDSAYRGDSECSVHDALKDNSPNVGLKLGEIDNARQKIEQANKSLGNEVDNLGSWKQAAGSVITKANEKCDEILKKVKTDKSGQKGPIFKEAETFKEKGKELLNVAQKAKTEVEKNVENALKAVVQMDGDLKMDLYKVREEIKTQIGSALKSINVLTLDELVKGDMKTLKERISDVTKDVGKDTKSSGLLQNELFKLDEARNTFNQNTVTPIQNAEKGLEVKFKEQIQEKLSAAVSEVDRAIQTLGGKFSQNDKKLQPIFEHIKKQVAEIKGNGGEWDNRGTWKTPGSGLDGIRTKVQKYVDAFSGWQFGSRITGWTEDILKHNGVVRPMIGRNLRMITKEQLEIDADTAGQEVQQRNNGAGGDIVKNISAVQAGCEHFADKLDERMKNSLSDTVEGSQNMRLRERGCKNCKNCSDEFCKKNSVLAAILCALSATVRQVGNELNSVLLEPPDTNIASILDTITPIASDLSDKLTQATEKSGSPPVSQGQPQSPAQAVDTAIGGVRNFVEGKNGNNLTKIFNDSVINNLKTQVGLLPTAVEAFDGVAKAQIKAAAKAAITAAAEQISDARGTIELGGKNNLMDTFNKQFTTIKSSLEGNIKKEVDDHIGQDDQTGGQGGDQKVELEKGKFPHYEKHVTQPVELDKTLTGKADDGHLPAAIGDIKTVGLAALEKPEIKNMNNETFTGPFDKVTNELEAIKELVEKGCRSLPEGV